MTGKQRKWCSEACRKKAERVKRKASANKRKASANRPLSPGRMVKMRLIIDSNGAYPHLHYEHLLTLAIQQVSASQKIKDFIRQELEKEIPGYDFQVVILAGPY